MKYHSLYWWLIAIFYQVKHIIRNMICRKILKINFGYTKPDILTLFTVKNIHNIYKFIIEKYPELTTIKKYIGTGYEATVTDFICAGVYILYEKKIMTLWTNYGNIEDIISLLKMNIPSNIIMENVLGVYHSVLVVGYDDEKDIIIFNDPYGDPWTRYLFVYGFNVTYNKDSFLEATGKNIKMSIVINYYEKEKIEQIKKMFTGRSYYILD